MFKIKPSRNDKLLATYAYILSIDLVNWVEFTSIVKSFVTEGFL